MRSRPQIEIIIPVRARDDYDVLSRLSWRVSSRRPQEVSIVVVDDGSPISHGRAIERFCNDAGMTYLRLGSSDRPFNLSRARNAGIRQSSADYLLFEDVDLIYPDVFLERLLTEAEVQIAGDQQPLLSVPVIYLSAEGSEDFALARNNPTLYSELITESQSLPSPRIENFIPVSSMLLMKRARVLDTGAFDEGYEGWGFEDHDFVYRTLHASVGPKPENFAFYDRRAYSEQLAFVGWRSLFRLYGDKLALKGIYALHIHHEPSPDKNSRQRRLNRKRFEDKCRLLGSPELSGNSADGQRLVDSILFDRYRLDALMGHQSGPVKTALRRFLIKGQSAPRPGGLSRKLHKLRREPKAFVVDALRNLMR